MIEVRQALSEMGYALPERPATQSVSARLLRSWQMRVSAALTLVIGIAWGIHYWYQRPAAAPTPGAAANDGVASLPQSPHELTQRAAQLLQRADRPDNIEQAIGLLEEALKLQPRHAPAHAYLADAYRRKNSTNPDPQWMRLAAESARRALELNPDLALAHSVQGSVHLDNGRFSEAEAEWRRAIELDPTSPLPYLGLGMGYAAQQRHSEAESSLREAVKRRGSDWRPDAELGSFFIRRGRFSEALASYEAARQLTPDNVIVWRNMGAAYFQLERYEDAAAAFQRSLEILPSAAVYTNLGTLRFFQGRYHDAVPAFEKAVELGANRALYWGNLADAYRWAPGRRGESLAAYERAIALLREDVAKQPSSRDLKTRLAAYLVKGKQTKEALDAIADLEQGAGLPSPVLKQLALVHELAGNRERALYFVDRALQAGYSAKEIANDPELTSLRADRRYHALVASRTAKTR
jgi:serine/threonine-protein kinase